MFAFHVEVWCLTAEDQTRELQGGGSWGSRGWQSVGVWGDKPGCTNVQAVALASAPTLQEAKPWNTGKTGLFPSLSQSILCSNQCERLARDSTAGLNSCTGVLGRGFQWCRKACTSLSESKQPCWSALPMRHARKSRNFCAHLPFCVCQLSELHSFCSTWIIIQENGPKPF